MTWLALARHGDPAPGGLSPRGEAQAASLGRQLRMLGAASALVLCSPAPRARATAAGLCAFLDLQEPEEDPRLWTGSDGPRDTWERDLLGLAGALAVRGADVELLVVVAHLELCSALPPVLFTRHKVGGTAPAGLGRGELLLLDLQERKGQLIRGG